MKKNIEMTTQSISKLLWSYSVPAMAGALIFILYNLVDRIFISSGLGRLAIAGISITLPIFTFILAISLLIGVGAGVLTSLNLGANKLEEANKILGTSVFLFVIIGIITSITGLTFIDEILNAFGATEANIGYAREYMEVIFYASPFQLLCIGLNNIVRAEGNPKKAMIMDITGAMINIILDPIFIFVFKTGIAGAAYATIIANIIVTFMQFYHFLGGSSKVKLLKKNIKFKFEITKQILTSGISPFIMQLSNSVIVIFINKSLNIHGGDIAIAAYGIINSINTLLFMPMVGIYQGSQPILGFNYGAKEYGRVRETYKKALFVTFLIGVVGFLSVMFIPNVLISPFIRNDIELQTLTIKALRIIFSMVMFLGLNLIGGNYFQSVGYPKKTAFVNIYKQIILMLGLLYILPKKFGINGVWYAVPLTEILTFSVVFFMIRKEMKRLKALEEIRKTEIESKEILKVIPQTV